jgi:6-pyruvoyl-tetrahydropterin synthase
MEQYGVQLENYFKFNCSYIPLKNGVREPLQGHNYKASIKVGTKELNASSYVIDFDELKPVMKAICDKLSHCVLLPKNNNYFKITEEEGNIKVHCKDEATFMFPANDVRVIMV